ncbi:MAG: HAMP domain-containing sensor histidine kinase [Chloroflexota bacterium]
MITLLLFVAQLILFTGIAIGLHYRSERIGIAPLLFMTAAMIGLLNIIELNLFQIVVNDMLLLRPGAHILIPVVLAIVLLLYTADGTRTAQIVLGGIVTVNLLVFITLLFLSMYYTTSSPDVAINSIFAENPFDFQFMRGVVASLLTFTLDMFVIIIVYQGVRNFADWIPAAIVPGIALVIALWTDAAAFNLLAFLGTPDFSLRVPSDIVMKTLAGIIIAPFIGYYFTQIASKMPSFVGANERSTFDILFPAWYDNQLVESLENQLRISRTIYTQLTQNIDEVFWLIDVEDMRFLYISPAYERITGYSVDPLYENLDNILTLIQTNERDITPEYILHFLTGERDTEFRIRRADQQVRWIRARAFPIKDQAGNNIRYAGIAEDITERKRLTEHAFELAVAEERVRILNNFISDASHDLKTPISAMILKISLLNRVTDEERRQQLRDEIRQRALYLSELINDLFTLSKIEGNSEIEMTDLNISQLVTDTVANIEPLAEEKGLQITCSTPAENIILQANHEQMTRVVSNLVSNAIRYTQVGNITVMLSADSENIILRVVDTGVGIAEEAHSKIFERFFRTQSARDTQEGTGLGLAITHAIVRRHHGTITVDSIVGKGSTFTVILPNQQPSPSNAVDIRRSTQEVHALSPSDYNTSHPTTE